MKKNLLYIVICFIILPVTLKAKEDRNIKKTILSPNKQAEITGLFSPSKIETYGYNSNMFSDEKSVLVENDSIPITTTTFEYNGNIVTGTTKIWINNLWSSEFRSLSYLGNNDIDSTITLAYDTISQNWKKESKWVQEFDGNLHTRDMIYVADSLTGNWIPMMKTEISYANGFVSEEEMSMYIPQTQQWMPMSKDRYNYVNGRLDMVEFLMPAFGTSEYEVNSRTRYFYNAEGNLDYEIDYNLNMFSQDWEATLKTEYKFNSKGMEYASYSYNYSEIPTQSWELMSIDSTVYANEEQPLIDLWYDFSDLQNDLLIREKTFYSYSDPIQSANQIKSFPIKIFPNPATEYFQINISEPKNSWFEIYSVSGELIKKQNINQSSTTVSTKNFNKGNYLVKVNANGKSNTQIIIVK